MPQISDESLINQLRRVLKDAIDYLQSVVQLLQARATEMALSSVVFVALIAISVFMGLLSFLMFNIALGVWLAYISGSPGWSILILGTFYALLAAICGGVAMRWLKHLKS